MSGARLIELGPIQWAFAAPILAAAIERGTDEARTFARAELERLARIADAAGPLANAARRVGACRDTGNKELGAALDDLAAALGPYSALESGQ